jgi:hypothetical protein
MASISSLLVMSTACSSVSRHSFLPTAVVLPVGQSEAKIVTTVEILQAWRVYGSISVLVVGAWQIGDVSKVLVNFCYCEDLTDTFSE